MKMVYFPPAQVYAGDRGDLLNKDLPQHPSMVNGVVIAMVSTMVPTQSLWTWGASMYNKGGRATFPLSPWWAQQFEPGPQTLSVMEKWREIL